MLHLELMPHCHSFYPVPPAKKQKMSIATASPVRVAVELGYQDLMTDLVSTVM